MTMIDCNLDSIEPHRSAAAVGPAMLQASADPIVICEERPDDADARESLLDRAFGPARFRKTCQKLRLGRLPARGLSLVARLNPGAGGGPLHPSALGDLVGTVRLWHVDAGGVPALMLGPLAVDARYRCYGIGSRLMEEALDRSTALGHTAVLLVGDAPYYARFGFGRRPTLGLRLPGPVEDERFLARELTMGALADTRGLVRPTGAMTLDRAPHSGSSRRRAA